MGFPDTKEPLTTESTKNIKPTQSFSYQNMVDIENITRTWFQLMVNLNESPKVRTFFATERYDENAHDWTIEPTEYTRHFLTSGLVIYEAKLLEDDRIECIAITKESAEKDITRVQSLSQNPQYSVTALFRWAGCGMRIPKDTKLSLNPNIVWPILTFDTEIEGKKVAIEIANSSNNITWKETSEGENESGKLMVTDKNFQGQARGDFHIPGKVDSASIKLVLPYTCASFDILTKIHLGDEDSELVIFTS